MKYVFACLLLLPAMLLQGQISDRIAPPELRPSFLFATVLLASIFIPGKRLAFVSFLGGLLEGALCGMYLGAFIVSRTISSLVATVLMDTLHLTFPVGVFVALVSAVVGHTIFLIIQPPSDVVWWIGTSLKQSLLTAFWVAIMYPLGRLVFGQRIPVQD